MKCERIEARRTGAGNQFSHLVWKIWWERDLASFAKSIYLSKGLLYYELLCWTSVSRWHSCCLVILKPMILPYVKTSSTERPLCWLANRKPWTKPLSNFHGNCFVPSDRRLSQHHPGSKLTGNCVLLIDQGR